MTPEQAMRQLDGVVNDIRAAGEGVELEPLLKACQQVAQRVREQAARSGHSIAVRVVERGNGVRLTVRGPHAVRYRSMASRELAALIPDARADIRAQVTRKAR